MVLIVGGEGAGKRAFAKSLGYTDAQISVGEVTDLPVVEHLERMLFADPTCGDALLSQLLTREIVVCNEVGSGIIPVDPKERRGREATGRLCVLLAQRATTVVRMVCGIPTVIKGELPWK